MHPALPSGEAARRKRLVKSGVGGRGLIIEFVVLTQLCGYGVRHELASVDIRRFPTDDRGVPTCFRIAVDGHLEIAGADPLLYDFFQLGRRLFWLIHSKTCERLDVTGHLVGTNPEYDRALPL
jgi:hypothetical protein